MKAKKLPSGSWRVQFRLNGERISVTAEIAQLLCDDVGSKAMGKSLQYLATAVSVCLMIPMIQALLSLIEEVLSKI